MNVWIDQDLCTGDGRCEEICPTVFQLVRGIAHVRDATGDPVTATDSVSSTQAPETELDDLFEAASACPGECIFIE